MKDLIRREIEHAILARMQSADVGTRWREPLVGVASAADPLFAELKRVASPDHLLPRDLLPEARTVVVFFLPFAKDIPRGIVHGELSSGAWSQAYQETNDLIASACDRVKRLLEAQGFSAATTPATHNFDPLTLLSRWSHRHVAWVAGLGGFGLNNMLITEKGCCGRLGSLVTTAVIQADPRPRREACLFRRDSSCTRCVGRCPVGALSPEGFDRQRCHARCTLNASLDRPWGGWTVCGKCLVGLPCSLTTPVRAPAGGPGS